MTGSVDATPPSPAPEDRRVIFISHRHEDKPLADVVANFLRGRSAGQVDVHQSSDANSEGPKPGSRLTKSLQDALWRAGRVILIFTRKDANWGWCLFECGVALRPDSPPTLFTVFTSGEAAPPQLADRVHVKIRDRTDVQRFTNLFLTDPGFFPGFDNPIAPGFQKNGSDVLAAAKSLSDDLDKIPDAHEESVQDWLAYPFLQLEVSPEERDKLCAEGGPKDRLSLAREVVRSARITDSDSEGARIFGRRSDMDADTRFGALIASWSEMYGTAMPPWVDVIAEQMRDGARWSWPRLRWVLMRSMERDEGRLYGPVVMRVRRWPDHRMQFDVAFYPFELARDTGELKLEMPPPVADEDDT